MQKLHPRDEFDQFILGTRRGKESEYDYRWWLADMEKIMENCALWWRNINPEKRVKGKGTNVSKREIDNN